MTTAEAIEHLRARQRLMEKRYVSDFPKWTVADVVALTLLLMEVNQIEHTKRLAQP